VEPEGLADAFPWIKRAVDQKASSQGDFVFFCFHKFEDESSFLPTKKATPME
jgi:hypothetical protein